MASNLCLPTAFEVWGKVMFSQASFILSTIRGGVCLLRGGGSASRQNPPPPPLPMYGQLAHPAGMQSCLFFLCRLLPKLHQRMVMEGTMLIGYQPGGKYVNSFRFITMNCDYVTKTDMDFVMKEIGRLGHDL